MKYMRAVFIILVAACSSAFAIDDTRLTWKSFADMLDTSTASQRHVLEKCGPSKTVTNNQGEKFLRYPSVGVTFLIQKEKIYEVHFASQDGKKISDRRFNGELPLVPLGATWHNYTIQQALASLGKPISEDRERAYVRLSYLSDDLVVMLYFLESRFAGLAVKKRE
jgi:hypothetical protein